ncbi:MAG: MlaD family protein, partial [Bacteroidales bacterium]|nr:MlaD family protein [Bacteroidales bacterium]
MKFKQEIKIGITVTVIIVLFLVGFNFLKGKNLFSSYNYYKIKYANVDGLQPSGAVDVNGLVVGLVTKIEFTSKRMDSLTVEIGVQKKLELPKNTVAQLNSGLLGGKTIRLLLGTDTQIAQNGDFLKDSITQGLLDKVDIISLKATNTMDSVNVTLRAVQQTLNSD